MSELQVFSDLHKFLSNLDAMSITLPSKSLSLGYKPRLFGRGLMPKFATLYGEKRYNCLIIHVDPGNQHSEKGKILQKEIQKLLQFDIQETRSFAVKKHEVYIPFEVINSKEKMELLKDFVRKQYKSVVTADI